MSDNQITPQYDKSPKITHKIDLELPSKKTKSSKVKHAPRATKTNSSSTQKKYSSLTPHAISLSILQKHSITPTDYSHHIVDNLIDSTNNHFIAIFKDHMIMDYVDEFLKRTYKIKESVERIPKFANYYKNYLLFFCKPMFTDLKLNELIQQYGEATAKVYYNQNYGKQKKKQKAHISDQLKTIFSSTVKKGIEQNFSLEISQTIHDESISLTENAIIFNNKDKYNHISYYEESLISLLDNFQQNKPNQKKRIVDHIPLPFTFYQNGNELKKKNIPFTERTDTSKDRLKKKESSEDMRTFQTHLYTSNNNHYLSRNINYNSNNNNLNIAKTVNSRNKPIKLTTGQPLHLKTVSVQLQGPNDNNIKNTSNMIYQTKTTSDTKMNSTKTVTQTKKVFGIQRKLSNNLNPSGTLNLNDVMKLTLKLYYPSTKRNAKNTIQHQSNNHHQSPRQKNTIQTQHHQEQYQHQHTLSSPTINNFNININNHICLNEAKSPKAIQNYNSNYSNSHSNFNLNPNEINNNRKKQHQQTIADELKKNINMNFDLKRIMTNSKLLSKNKPQSLTKTKTADAKAQPNLINRNSINLNQNKLFSSFSIFDIQQQLLNSKVSHQMNSKHTIGNNRKSNDHPSSNQQQSLSQTKFCKTKNLQTVKSQSMKKKINANHTGQSTNHVELGGTITQANFRLFNKKI